MVTDESVAEFISLTSASDDEAKGYLEMAGGNLQQALGLFFEMGGGSPALGPSPSPAPAASATHQPVIDADVAAEVAAAAAAAGIDTGPLEDAHMAAEEEVRAPLPAYQDQIINPELEHRRMQEQMAADSAAMFRRMSFDRGGDSAGAGSGTGEEQQDEQMGEGKAINKLFAPPEYNEGSSYYDTIEKAKAEGKWVLVNIQQAEVFASHTLNRDVWSDDTIKDIITGSFLFWQRDDKSAEGDQFCHYHQCGHQLPHICVIDPRTGRRVKNWDGRKWVESHAAAEYLFGFLDQFSMSRSPPSMSPTASPVMHPKASPPDPSQIQLHGFEDMEVEGVETKEEPVPALPEEPAEGTEHLKVSFRLPSGQRVARRFRPDDRLEQMFVVAAALTEKPTEKVDLATQFPTRSLREVEGGLSTLIKDAKVAGNLLLVNIRSCPHLRGREHVPQFHSTLVDSSDILQHAPQTCANTNRTCRN
ncbi:PUX7 [Symbiodinium natans]|uniref:PUX7 protein n=1 Tax=Symbiodinium natans TaxID=878477 RepID=A0A812I3C9_9DINO|nr:PUX7 [Symbiodinium natans]